VRHLAEEGGRQQRREQRREVEEEGRGLRAGALRASMEYLSARV
jgi:hypothetical protein